jgi:Ca2+-binding RTX toxin-like protein
MNRLGKIAGVALISALSISFGASHASAGQGGETCNGLTPTITGSGVINGTPKNDVILGSAGNDTINGGGGDDIICGGEGDDTIYGGTGDDQLFGDWPYGENNSASSGNDWIDAGSGDDYVQDYWGAIVYGGSGRDVIEAGGPMYGGAGADVLHAIQTTLILTDGGTGQDTCEFDVDNVEGHLPPVSCEKIVDL